MPLFARIALDLNLGYREDDLTEGRRHKNQTTNQQIRFLFINLVETAIQSIQNNSCWILLWCHAALITSTLT